jgi:hypothetical protein
MQKKAFSKRTKGEHLRSLSFVDFDAFFISPKALSSPFRRASFTLTHVRVAENYAVAKQKSRRNSDFFSLDTYSV